MWYVTHLRVGADESVSILTPNKNVRTAFEILETPIRFLIKQPRGRVGDNGGQFLITIGTNPYQNTYFIFFFTVFSYVFSLFSPVFQDLQNTPTEYNRIHCILNNTREYTQNTHRIHNVQKRRKVLFAQYTC